jgi:CHAD domain-containing protein
VRRLRSTLAAYKPELAGGVGKREARRLRKAARGTNAGRDLEVQLAWLDAQRARMYSRQRPGALWLRARLAAAKRDADARAAGAVGKKAEKALAAMLRELPAYTVRARVALPGDPPRPAARFAGVVAARLREGAAELGAGLTAYAALRAAPGRAAEASEQAHEARLAAKRVRYLLEPVAKLADGAKPALERLRHLQEQLGELHDLDVLAEVLARARDDAAAEADEAARSDAAREDAAAPPPAEGGGPPGADPAAEADAVSNGGPAAGADASPSPTQPAPDVRPGLVALTRRVTARRAALEAEIDAAWLAGGGAALVAELDAVAARAEAAHGGPGVEIERKYLLRALPAAAPRGRRRRGRPGLPAGRTAPRARAPRPRRGRPRRRAAARALLPHREARQRHRAGGGGGGVHARAVRRTVAAHPRAPRAQAAVPRARRGARVGGGRVHRPAARARRGRAAGGGRGRRAAELAGALRGARGHRRGGVPQRQPRPAGRRPRAGVRRAVG